MTARSAFVAVLRRELRLLFLAPVGWIFLAGALALVGVFFHQAVVASGEASVRPALGNWIAALIVCLPPVTARQLAGEARAGTLDGLLGSPVPAWTVVLGKWAAATTLCAAAWALALAFPGFLLLVGDPDPGVLATTWLGLLLCSASFAAAGLLASALTDDPAAATVGGALLLLPGWLLDASVGLVPDALRSGLLGGFVAHLRPFAEGAVDAGDVAWFVGLALGLLLLTVRAVERRRRVGLGIGLDGAVGAALCLLALTLLVDVAGRAGPRWELDEGPVVVRREALLQVEQAADRGARILVSAARSDHPSAADHDRALERMVARLARDGTDARLVDLDRDPERASRLGLRRPASVVLELGDQRLELRDVTEGVDRTLAAGPALTALRWTIALLPISVLALGGALLLARRR